MQVCAHIFMILHIGTGSLCRISFISPNKNAPRFMQGAFMFLINSNQSTSLMIAISAASPRRGPILTIWV